MDDRRRCTAKTAASGYAARCKKAAVRGGTVCQTHGAGAPQVKKAARQRLDEMVEPALSLMERGLARMLATPGMEMSSNMIKLAGAVLDRAGYPRAQRLEIEEKERAISEDQGRQIVAVIEAVLHEVGVDPSVVRERVAFHLLTAAADKRPEPRMRLLRPPEPEPEPEEDVIEL